MSTQWINDTPVHSNVEEKLRGLLVEIGSEKILGIQVCAYKGGRVIIDTTAGVLGRYDPRPVQPDTLFPVFSVTKGITAGMVHWLVDNGKLKYDEAIANIWPNFGNNGKELIKVHHVLNHTSGLHNGMGDVLESDPLSLCDWEKSLDHIARLPLETEPGSQQIYHYISFGWLCGGVIEHASGKKFQEVLEEAIVRPLNIEGEMYIGIPPGVESRLATLTMDMEEFGPISQGSSGSNLPASPQANIAQMATGLPALFNTLNIRRAIIPAANGHVTARALARYYAALATGGTIPPPHSNLSKPPLGSHAHIPKFPPSKPQKKKKGLKDLIKGSYIRSNSSVLNSEYTLVDVKIDDGEDTDSRGTKVFKDSKKILDAFTGAGEFSSLVVPNGLFGLGFGTFGSGSGGLMIFGHSGIGGSTGFCNAEHDFSIAITVNKMSTGGVTKKIIQLVCAELDIPVPDYFSEGKPNGPDMQIPNVDGLGR